VRRRARWGSSRRIYPEYIPEPIDDLIRSKHDIKLPRDVMRPGDPRWFK
jgi:trimethylamine---corrinoid protein Co-methyltransferase